MSHSTLTARQRDILALAPAEWGEMPLSPSNKTMMQLDNRQLIEIRLNPTADRTECVFNAKIGWPVPWQWRRKPLDF